MIQAYTRDDLIAIGMIVIGVLAFYEARTSFPYEEGVFPMMASGIMVVAAGIWLLRSFLPQFLYSALIEFEEPGGIEEITGEEESADDIERADAESPPMYPLILLSIGYVILAYLVGFLWATPFFVTAYGIYRGFEPKSYLVVNAIAFLIVFSFAFFTTYQIDQGIIWGTNL